MSTPLGLGNIITKITFTQIIIILVLYWLVVASISITNNKKVIVNSFGQFCKERILFNGEYIKRGNSDEFAYFIMLCPEEED